jgi:hypothetical protein
VDAFGEQSLLGGVGGQFECSPLGSKPVATRRVGAGERGLHPEAADPSFDTEAPDNTSTLLAMMAGTER